MNSVLLALGSNIGNREKNFQQAIELLNEHEAIQVIKVSSFIQTKAVAKYPQPDYLNGALLIKTILTPMELLTFTQEIEKELGRESKGKGEPRTIDIDILLYNQELICLESLTIPHPLLHERAFVLIPLNEIAGDFTHPIFQETISDIYKRVVGY